jgi:protein LTV1
MLRIRGSLNGKGPKAAEDSQAARITIDPKTGFPVVINPVDSSMAEEGDGTESDSTVDAEEANSGMKRQTITRPKHETPEEKKARKMQVKAEKQSRKQEKKATTEAFGAERKKQMKVKKNHLRDAADVAKGNTRNIKVTSLS